MAFVFLVLFVVISTITKGTKITKDSLEDALKVPVLVIENRLADFVLRIHHERAIFDDGLA